MNGIVIDDWLLLIGPGGCPHPGARRLVIQQTLNERL
jgi:hypothetical protein